VDSGIYTLPFVLSLPVAGVLSSAFTQRIGYYVPSMIFCPCLMAIGEGLLTTLKPTTGSSQWIAYQFLVGFGLGSGMQTVALAVQTTLPREDIPTGMAITFWAQQLGGAVFVAIGQAILSGVLIERLGHLSGVDAKLIVETGVIDLHDLVPAGDRDQVVDAFNVACTRIFLVAAVLSAVQVFFAVGMQWKSIKKGMPGIKGPVK
jgi:MFS family permease